MCRATPTHIYDYQCFGEFGSGVWGLCWLCPWYPPSVEATLALTEPCCAGRSMPPVWCGPSCLDIESEAPLTGDRTGVSGESLESVSFRFWGLTRFGDFMAEKKQMIVDRERSQIEADEIFRLMQGNGNQSRINDGKLSPS